MEKKPNKKLDEIPKKEVFQVPDGYFETLEQKIHSKIGEKPAGKVVPFYVEHRWKIVGLAAAASIAFLLMFLPTFNQKTDVREVEQLLAQVSAEDCLTYLEFSELDIEDIIGSTPSEDIEEALDDYMIEGGSEIQEEDLDLLYEKFGATSDEKLKTL
jgi:hypothetical protein